MKLSKYIFLFPSAINTISRRYKIKPLSMGELFVLYTIEYLPMNASQQAIIRHAKQMQYPIGQSTISEAIKFLISVDFVKVVDGRLSVHYLGREYLSALRRYLLHKRLS